jgi:hypothetical protein
MLYFKCHLQSHLKFVKISLKSYFLFICCNMFRHHRAIIRKLIDRNRCPACAHTSINLHAIITCSRIRECTPALPSCYLHVAAFTRDTRPTYGNYAQRNTQYERRNKQVAWGHNAGAHSWIWRHAIIACKYIDVWAHAVQGFRSMNFLMMALWGRNMLHK